MIEDLVENGTAGLLRRCRKIAAKVILKNGYIKKNSYLYLRNDASAAMSQRFVTDTFFLPAGLYLRLLLRAFVARWWGMLTAALIVVLGVSWLFADAIYVVVILLFAAIPLGLFHFFVGRLTRLEERRLLSDCEAAVDDGGVVLCYRDGLRCYWPWEYVLDFRITRRYYLLYTADENPPFVYLPREAFGGDDVCEAFERLLLSKFSAAETTE